MKVEVLISCMHQNDASIIENTNISSDVLVINQTEKNEIIEFKYLDKYNTRIFSTKERGLSNSRNMAVLNAKGDICLICDDDEVLVDNYSAIIIKAFKNNPKADIIAFAFKHPTKKFHQKVLKINYLSALKISSCQIAFRKDSILKNKIIFDKNFGSGTKNGPGEETLFLYECLKNKLKILYIPEIIGSVAQTNSQWFKGFTPKYFFDRGKLTRKLMGAFIATLYAIEFSIAKYPIFKKEITFLSALKNNIKGIFVNYE